MFWMNFIVDKLRISRLLELGEYNLNSEVIYVSKSPGTIYFPTIQFIWFG